MRDKIIRYLDEVDIGSVSQIARAMKKPRTTIDYHVRKLLEDGTIAIRPATAGRAIMYTLSKGAAGLVNSLETSGEGLVNAHRILVKTAIRKRPGEKLFIAAGFTQGDHMKGWGPEHFYGLKVHGCSVVVTSRSILLWVPTIHAQSSYEALLKAYSMSLQAVREMEKTIPGLELGEPSRRMYVADMHVAHPGDHLAMRVMDLGVSQVMTDRFSIDKSQSPGEIEFISESAVEDSDAWTNFIQELELDPAADRTAELVEAVLDGSFSPLDISRRLGALETIAAQNAMLMEKMTILLTAQAVHNVNPLERNKTLQDYIR